MALFCQAGLLPPSRQVTPCLAGFAVAQCINQHSSPSVSSPSPSASGSPSGSGSSSHCDSGGASSSSTPSVAQSPSGIGHVIQCGRDFGEPCNPLMPRPLIPSFSSLPCLGTLPLSVPRSVYHDAAHGPAGVAPCRVEIIPSAGWSTERPSLTAELEGMDSRQAELESIPLSPPKS